MEKIESCIQDAWKYMKKSCVQILGVLERHEKHFEKIIAKSHQNYMQKLNHSSNKLTKQNRLQNTHTIYLNFDQQNLERKKQLTSIK